jgi:hypothetical protein
MIFGARIKYLVHRQSEDFNAHEVVIYVGRPNHVHYVVNLQ